MLRALLVASVAAAAFVGGLTASLTVLGRAGSEVAGHSDRFWSAATVRGMAAESFDTLDDLARSADLVIVGRVNDVQPGREWVAIPEYVDDPVFSEVAYARFATVTIDIEQIIGRVLSPLPDRSVVKLEVFLSRPDTLTIVQKNIPGERSIFFLRNKGVTDSIDFYRFTNDDQGLLREFDGRIRISPTGEDHFLSHLDGESFDKALDAVTKARGGS